MSEPTVTIEPTTTPIPADVSQGQTSSQAMPTQTTPVEPAGDILTRVSKRKEVPVIKEPTAEEAGQTFKEFDAIPDPALKAEAIRKYKEVQSYATKTNQEKIALQKQYEDFQKQSQNWTPERIQRELLNNPQFISAAQTVNQSQNPAGSGLTDEQFSALTPAEKGQLLQVPELRTKVNQLEQQNFIAAVANRDSVLSSKYGDYDALKVNQSFRDLANMNVIDVREHIYKATMHDAHVQNAYEEGLKDGKGLTQERKQAVTISSNGQTMPASDVPKKDKGENDINYFARLAQRRIDQAKGMRAAAR